MSRHDHMALLKEIESGGLDHLLGADEGLVNFEDDLERAAFLREKYANSDELIQKVRLRRESWKGLNEVAPFFRTNPASVLQGNLGGQQDVVVGGPAITVAQWGGPDAETVPVTVTFGPVVAANAPIVLYPAGIVGPPAVRPFGIVQWGTRSAMLNIVVDILRGCQFTVNASQINLQVGLDDTGAGSLPTTCKLAGMLSFQRCTRTTPLTRTFQFADALAAPLDFPVPSFARTVQLMRSDSAGTAFTIDCWDSVGNIIYTYTLAAGAVMDPFLLPNGTETIEVTQTAGGAAPGVLSFELAL